MTTRKINSRTKVKCRRIGTPINRMDPTEPGLAARGVLRASAKQTSQTIVTQAAADGRRQHAVSSRQKTGCRRQDAGGSPGLWDQKPATRNQQPATCQPLAPSPPPQYLVHRFIVCVDAPLFYLAFLHHCQPRCRRAPLISLDGAACCAEYRNAVSVAENLFVRGPIIRAHAVVSAPAAAHLFPAFYLVSQRVGKDVIFRHQLCQLVYIALVDAVQK